MKSIIDNFEELDLRIIEETVIQNNGSIGESLYTGKDDNIHGFKRLNAGSNVTLTTTDNTITVSAAEALDSLIDKLTLMRQNLD